jgi:hypothetical protein
MSLENGAAGWRRVTTSARGSPDVAISGLP